MKFLKMLGLAAVAAGALMAFAGVATATTVTSPTGTAYTSTIKAELNGGEAVLASSFIGEVKCKKSIVEGKVESHGAGVTAKGKINTLDFTECNNTTHVLKSGTLEVHGEGNYNGILTSSGAEVTVVVFGLDCIFTTNNTNIGTVTGGSPATFQAAAATIPRTGGSAFCGASASWTAPYKIVTPGSLYID